MNKQKAKCEEISKHCYEGIENKRIVDASVIMMPLKPTKCVTEPVKKINEKIYNLPMVLCRTEEIEHSFFFSLFEYENNYYTFLFSGTKIEHSSSLITNLFLRAYFKEE